MIVLLAFEWPARSLPASADSHAPGPAVWNMSCVEWLQVEVPGLQWKYSRRNAGRDNGVPRGPTDVSTIVHSLPSFNS